MSEPKKSSDADELMEFLNSLPEGDKRKEGKSDEDILEFLDELEANNKGEKVSAADSGSASTKTASKPEVVLPKSLPTLPTLPEKQDPTTTLAPSIDPIGSISSWWSSEGSSKVTSLWGSAQQRAEEALQLAKEKGLDQEHLRKAFSEIVITDGDDKESEDQDSELKLPDAGKAIESLNRGFGLFSSRLGSVIDKLNTDLSEYSNGRHDEILNIRLTHDLKNYHYVNNLIGNNFKKVMNSQVDGDLLIQVSDNHISDKNDDYYKRNLNIFHGKISDCEKLIMANLDESIKTVEKERKLLLEQQNQPGLERETNIFIGLHPVTIPSTTVSDSTGSDNINIDLYNPGNFSFIIILKDTTHDLTIVTKSQPFPMKWANWVDGSTEKNVEEVKEEVKEDAKDGAEDAEEEEVDVDPSQWVKGWIKDGLDLSLGVLAQSYVIKRMGF